MRVTEWRLMAPGQSVFTAPPVLLTLLNNKPPNHAIVAIVRDQPFGFLQEVSVRLQQRVAGVYVVVSSGKGQTSMTVEFPPSVSGRQAAQLLNNAAL